MWTYEISTGKMYDPQTIIAGSGYSGHPPHVNDVSAVGLKAIGPIPPGNWTLGSLIERDPNTGEYTIVLVPDAPTRAYILSLGRDPDSFRCHGDFIGHVGQCLASDGCIVQILPVRMEMWESLDHGLQTVPTLSPAAANLDVE